MVRLAVAAFLLLAAAGHGRTDTLPAGTYEPYFTDWSGSLAYLLTGDIVIESAERYRFLDEAGRYSVDPVSGRITFSGGGLDGAYAVVRQSSGQPAIVIPHAENEKLGREYAISDIWAYRSR